MSEEEKKEETQAAHPADGEQASEEPKADAPAEETIAETPVETPAEASAEGAIPEAPAETAEAPAKAATEAPAKPTRIRKKRVKPTNCSKCNGSLRVKTPYYRNGAYYCNKRCFKAAVAEKTAKSKE